MTTTAQIDLVQSSFQKVLPIADVAGELLYGRIFFLAPESRALFDDDIRPQAKRTMAAVQFAVEGLGRLERSHRSSSNWAAGTCGTACGRSISR